MNQTAHSVHVAPVVPGKRYSMLQKLAVGSGQSVEAAVSFVAATFLLFYLTNVCGIDPTIAGTILFISLAVDAVADPLIGSWSDRLRSRWGRRLPFMVIALPVVSLATVALFSIPVGWGHAAVITCALLSNIVLRVGTSLYALPYAAMTAELTTDYNERSSIAAYRALFSFVAAFACALPAFRFIFDSPQKMSSAAAHVELGLLVAAVVFVTGALCLFGLSKMPRSHGPALASKSPHGSIVTDIRELLRNRSFVVLFISCLLCLVVAGSLQALNLYAYQYYWRLSAAQTQQAVLTLQAGFLLGIPSALLLLRIVEKRTAMAIGFIALAAVQGLLPLMAKLAPFAAIPASVIVCTMTFVFGVCASLLFITMQSMVADAVDEHEYRFGTRCEGLYYSSLVFATKAATGLGSLLAGVMLSAAGLKGVQSVSGASGLSAEGATLLGMLWGPGHGLLFVLILPILLCYRIDRREHARIIAALAQRAA